MKVTNTGTAIALVFAAGCSAAWAQGASVPEVVRVPAGSFVMGADAATLSKATVEGFGVMSERPRHGDFDEVPAHTVRISRPFAMSTTEVTEEEFREFDQSYRKTVTAEQRAPGARPGGKDEGGNPAVAVFTGYAAGVSWQQAMDYCAWLTKRTGKPWRLPTEAEWEYAARAGGKQPFGAEAEPPKIDAPNAWGVKNMGVGRPEWVLDWYGMYGAGKQVDPVGPAGGLFKVVRGGGLDYRHAKPGQVVPAQAPYFERAANRASMAPSYRGVDGNIGFRVVQAAMPHTQPTPVQRFFFETAVKQTGLLGSGADAKVRGPEASKPWYHTHELFPDIGKKSMPGVGWKVGLAPGLGINYHNSAIQEMPNGDWLAAYYNTPDKEDDPDQTVLIMRRRAGSETWDMPEPWPDFADAANAAPVIWNDPGYKNQPGQVWLFWGFPRLIGAGPFAYTTSRDSGATWSAVAFPKFPEKIGRFVPQPINSVVRTADGTILMPTDSTGRQPDGNGSVSAVWGTKDDGKTWFDTGGRTAGRHTTLAVGKDGQTLLGFGGKNSNIEGRMPLATSTDGGRTWVKSKTPFDQLLSGERPSVIRLKSGRLFFVADYNPTNNKHVHKDGAYVALSDDDGKTWTMKRLPTDVLTVGYTTATQGTNGVIHVVTSKNQPNYEIELNEAWVLDKEAGASAGAMSGAVTGMKEFTEKNAGGGKMAAWSVGRGADGRILLDGPETFWYPNGKMMWTIRFRAGERTGEETYFREDGTKEWMKVYGDGGDWTWRRFNGAGKQIAESKWHGKRMLSTDVPDPPVEKKSGGPTEPDAEGL